MNPRYHTVLGSVVLITNIAVTALTPAQEASSVMAATLKPQGLHEGLGLAAAYPGDESLERDPRVLFVEDFETGTVLELGDRWGNATRPENLSFSPDIPLNSPGNRSLRIAKTGHLFTHTRGVDRMHARFYVKFHARGAEGCESRSHRSHGIQILRLCDACATRAGNAHSQDVRVHPVAHADGRWLAFF